MAIDKKRENIKNLIEKGHIRIFREILEYYPITPLIKHLKSSHQRLTKYFNDVSLFRFSEVIVIGEYFGVDEKLMFDLVYNQIIEDKKKKKSTSSSKKKS